MLFNPATIRSGYAHDSVLYRFNNKAQALEVFNMCKTFCIQEKVNVSRDSMMFIGLNFVTNGHDGKFYMGFSRYHNAPGDSVFSNSPAKISGFFDLRTKDFSFLPVTFPAKIGEYYARDYEKFKALTAESNKVVFSFPQSNQLTVYEPGLATSKVFTAKSYFTDSISPMKEFLPRLKRPASEPDKGIY